MEPKVWMNDVRNVLLTQFNAIRIFYFILLYLLISYDAFSTNSTLSPSANGQTYAIPLANGGYELTLIFKKTSAIADGSISVTAEGQKIVNDLASHMSSDGKTSFSVVRTVVVKDGTLNIQYSSPVAKLAVLLKQTDASSTPTYNDPPVASLVQPSDATYLGGDDITLVAKVSDGDGKVTQASFWVDDKKINEQTVSTASGHVSFVWKSVPVGDYQVQVKVKDNDGATASSTKLTYKVKSEDDPSSNPEEPETPEEPEAPVAEGEPGLYYAYYVGEWDVLPDFSELQPESQGVVPNFTFA
ncbi:MAG: triple tyrosine motif-containing protein, partial [Cyclobacteriaceae bacterium]